MKKTLAERQAEMRERQKQERKLLRESLIGGSIPIKREAGAVVSADCWTRTVSRNYVRKCHCGKCAICGCDKHTAIHGPVNGGGRGSKPFGHEFVAKASI